ncbi:MAG: hypothetical protein ACSLE6_18450 [Mycobacterium sp.]
MASLGPGCDSARQPGNVVNPTQPRLGIDTPAFLVAERLAPARSCCLPPHLQYRNMVSLLGDRGVAIDRIHYDRFG